MTVRLTKAEVNALLQHGLHDLESALSYRRDRHQPIERRLRLLISAREKLATSMGTKRSGGRA